MRASRCLILSLIAFACSGCSAELLCSRAPGDTVDCDIREWFFGVPSRSAKAQDVTGAYLQSIKGTKGGYTTRVVLQTRSMGEVPFTNGSSSGIDVNEDGKQRVVENVNGFVRSKTAPMLKEKTREGFFLTPILVVVFGFPMFWKRIKSRLERMQQRKNPVFVPSGDVPAGLTVHCRACGERIAAGSIDVTRGLARCDGCQSMSDVSAQLGAALKRPLPLPPGVQLRELAPPDADKMPYRGQPSPKPLLEVTRRWFVPGDKLMAVYLAGWTVAIWAILWPLRAQSLGFTLALAALAIAATYPVIAWAVNRTRIQVDEWHVSLRHGPLPWPGSREVLIDSLEQLYVKQAGSDQLQFWELRAKLKAGGDLNLIGSLRDPAQALYLEHELEKRLGITNVRVDGAYV